MSSSLVLCLLKLYQQRINIYIYYCKGKIHITHDDYHAFWEEREAWLAAVHGVSKSRTRLRTEQQHDNYKHCLFFVQNSLLSILSI